MFVVDHRLQADSARWTTFALDQARQAGAEPVSLAWDGDKPDAGLPAAARAARHRLIADAAPARGVRVVLFGHTADDVDESAWMRDRGTPIGRLRPWAPSPAWPEGRGVFILRPLLGVRRSELRDLLRRRGASWLDDPANADVRFGRARARQALANAAPAPTETPRAVGDPPPWSETWGAVGLPRRASLDEGRLAALLVCVSGRERPPRGAPLARLLARLHDEAPFTSTLAGAQVAANDHAVWIVRERGRRASEALTLQPGVEAVWDGRFLVRTNDAGVTVRPLAGLAGRLSRESGVRLRQAPPAVRPTLPVFVAENGAARCPLLESASGPHAATSLVGARLHAAWGGIARESDVLPPSLLAR